MHAFGTWTALTGSVLQIWYLEPACERAVIGSPHPGREFYVKAPLCEETKELPSEMYQMRTQKSWTPGSSGLSPRLGSGTHTQGLLSYSELGLKSSEENTPSLSKFSALKIIHCECQSRHLTSLCSRYGISKDRQIILELRNLSYIWLTMFQFLSPHIVPWVLSKWSLNSVPGVNPEHSLMQPK